MGRIFRSITVAILLLLLATPALAQGGKLVYHDDAGRLDRSRVQSAAQPLINRGATVAVYAEESGNDATFQQRLEQDGLAQGASISNNVIAIFVSLDRYSAIRFGDQWNAALSTNDNYDQIRKNDLNAGLSPSDFSDGFVNALNAIDQAIASPPTVGGGTTNNFNFTPLVLGVIFLALLFVGGPILWRSVSKRRAIANAYAAARQAAEDARKQAGAAIADMGQVMKITQEKAQYDQVSYPAAEVAQLTRIQSTAEAQFVKAQEQFDNAGEALAAKREPTQEAYQAATGAYGAVTEQVAQARSTLDQAEARRAELDKLNAAAPGEVERSKKALADAAERLQAHGQDFPRPDAILRPGQELVARADSLLAEHRAADAITAAGAASATIDQLNDTLASYSDIQEGISAGRAGTEKATHQGYRVEAGLAALDRAEGLLREAATALEQDVAKARALLEQAEAARAEGVARGGGMPALRKANDAHLALVEQAGQLLAEAITAGHNAFGLVDEFAENTWSDIRGNGSEAETAADHAHELWTRATQRNTMEQQDFLGAQQDLDEADKQIAFAHTLVDSILQRLKDLEAARDTARQDITSAQADIDQGWSYVHSNDPDIGKLPEQALVQAEALIKQANTELAKQRPDWLAIVKQAREANRLADQSLVNARSEVEVMNKLREQATHAQQLATAEVQKIVQFTAVHGDDIPASSEKKLTRLQSDVQRAYQVLKAAEQVEEQTRADDLREAITRYTELQTNADTLYDEIYDAFQRIEQIRQRVSAAMQAAQQAITRAEYAQKSAQSGNRSSGDQYLRDAHAAFQSIGAVRGEAQMQRALELAEEARKAAEQAESIFRRHTGGQSGGDFLGGVVIGSVLNSGHGGRDHGGGWGSGGGGGGSWGGGGGGGSWGGGGGGGGSFGGGGGGGG
ncbi:MAG: chromosome partitioning protein ParA, partial [Roseiflexaceae bacterium]